MRRSYTSRELVRTLVRRRWVVLVPLAVGLAAAGPIGSLAAQRFQSDVVIGASAGDGGGIDAVESRLTGARLEPIVKDLNLYADERASGGGVDAAVARMRSDIEVIEGNSSGSYRIRYSNSEPGAAQSAARQLAALYVEGERAGTEPSGDAAALDAEIAEAKRRLSEHEARMAEFRREQAGQIRSQLRTSLQAIQRTQAQLQSVTETLEQLQNRRVQLEQQLTAATRSPAAAADAVSGTQQQLGMARAQLQLLKLRLPPDHADVISLERTILEIEARAAEETARGGGGPRPAAPQTSDARVRDIQAEIQAIDRQLEARRSEEARLRRALEQQSSADAVSTEDAELVRLTREHGDLQAAHAALVARKTSAAAAPASSPSESGGFTILDPASPPVAAGGGTRVLVMMAVPLAGLLCGLVLLALMERRDSSFRQEGEVKRALGVPVLGAVPDLLSDEEQQVRRKRTLMTDLAGGAALLASAALLVLW